MRITFDYVQLRDSKNCKCRACGKRLRLSKTFRQTLNPFNKNADGTLKDSTGIHGELKVEAAAWQKQREICKGCRP
jgi:hypothetical protein